MAFGLFGKAASTASAVPSSTSQAAVESIIAQSQNLTASNGTSVKDIALLGPRLVTRGVSLIFDSLPRQIDGYLGLSTHISNAFDAVGLGNLHVTGDGAAVVADPTGAAAAGTDPLGESLGLGTIRSFAGMFTYMTSRWALVCFTASLLLNRTQVYASTRRPLRFGFGIRLAVRLVPILLFTHQVVSLLQALKCQTSPEYSSIRHGKPGKQFSLDYAGDGGFLYGLSSTMLFWQDDRGCCEAVNMAKTSKTRYGSLVLLWPVFQSLCVSHFVETLSCALQGMPVRTETGMSIFEHSLAFAEVETMVSNSVGLGLFGLSTRPSPTKGSPAKAATSDTSLSMSRAFILDRLNVPPEVLLIALISCCNSLTSNILGVFGLQNRFRLINTTVWGVCFMAAFTWGFFNMSEGNTGIFRFPTVCIVGFIPHLLILIGIFVCACVYLLAMVISAFALPADLPRPNSLKERFALAHENLQGNVQIRGLRLDMHQDFYSALLKIGFTALTAASEAVFLNEGRSIEVRRFTWLEEDRLDEIEAARKEHPLAQQTNKSSGAVQIENASLENVRERRQWESGYSKERSTQILKDGGKTVHSHIGPGGVGALQRSSRSFMMYTFLNGIFWLIFSWTAVGIDKMLDKTFIRRRPRWFRKLVGKEKPRSDDHLGGSTRGPDTLNFWMLTDEGELELPKDDDVDVEFEMRKRLRMETGRLEDEATLDSRIYDWFAHGGWWGTKDGSGSYAPSNFGIEDDLTSVISSSSTNTGSDWESESDGQRTPTQRTQLTRRSPFSTTAETPLFDGGLDPRHLAALLNPQDAETRHEAQILASHLSAPDGSGVMTRSKFRRSQEAQRAKILTSGRHNHTFSTNASSSADQRLRKPTPQEEAEILEHLILSRRAAANDRPRDQAADAASQSGWQTGSPGLGSSGPQCVVCQAEPRTIIAWPCRCLCICEDCRVSLAMNNFGSCVTCRRDVGGFVRLYVP